MQFRNELSDITTGTRTKRAHEEIVDRLLAADSSLDPDTARRRAAVVLEAEPLGLGLKQAADGPEVKPASCCSSATPTSTRSRLGRQGLQQRPRRAALVLGHGHRRETSERRSSAAVKEQASQSRGEPIKTAMTSPGDALDVALFGRMVAELPEGNVDAACQVATRSVPSPLPRVRLLHRRGRSPARRPEGADMIGTVQFNASCLYRYAALDAYQLAKNLGAPAMTATSARLLPALPGRSSQQFQQGSRTRSRRGTSRRRSLPSSRERRMEPRERVPQAS